MQHEAFTARIFDFFEFYLIFWILNLWVKHHVSVSGSLESHVILSIGKGAKTQIRAEPSPSAISSSPPSRFHFHHRSPLHLCRPQTLRFAVSPPTSSAAPSSPVVLLCCCTSYCLKFQSFLRLGATLSWRAFSSADGLGSWKRRRKRKGSLSLSLCLVRVK